jgi:pyruvate ferredoxin oxidoreductase gamma subunit
MESIGGLGANLAGKILADAGMIGMGYNGASFASYGSEKKGSPVKAFVRFCEPEVEVRINQQVGEPHLLVIFHENLINALPVTQGVKPDAKIVVNTSKSPEEIRKKLKLHGGIICCVDAMKIAVEENVKLNTAMLGAITAASGFISGEEVKKVIQSTFGSKYPQLVEPNLKAFNRGIDELVSEEFKADSSFPYVEYTGAAVPALGYDSQPLGGTLPVCANNIHKDLSANRSGYIPLYHADKCTHCANCDLVCPDLCFNWKEVDGKMFLQGIDYRYCKGCLKCVEACPFNALTKEIEAEHEVSKLSVSLFDLK